MIGKLVMLNSKSIEDFYRKNENADCFMGIFDDGNRFLDYVNHIVGFENGERIGIITGWGFQSFKVEFVSPISGELIYNFYGEEELDIIGDLV